MALTVFAKAGYGLARLTRRPLNKTGNLLVDRSSTTNFPSLLIDPVFAASDRFRECVRLPLPESCEDFRHGSRTLCPLGA